MNYLKLDNDKISNIRFISTPRQEPNIFYNYYFNRAHSVADRVNWNKDKKAKMQLEKKAKMQLAIDEGLRISEVDLLKAVIRKLLARTEYLVDA